jgi:hypothetical protein
MFQPRYALGRTVPSRLATVAAAAAGITLTLFSGAAASSSIVSSCPSGSSLKSAAGQSLTRGESVTAQGSIVCSYTGQHHAGLGIEIIPFKVSTSLYTTYLKEAVAKYKGAKVQSISGLGHAAIEYTQNNAKSSQNGVADSGVIVIASGKEVVVAGDLPAKNVLAIARSLVG